MTIDQMLNECITKVLDHIRGCTAPMIVAQQSYAVLKNRLFLKTQRDRSMRYIQTAALENSYYQLLLHYSDYVGLIQPIADAIAQQYPHVVAYYEGLPKIFN